MSALSTPFPDEAEQAAAEPAPEWRADAEAALREE